MTTVVIVCGAGASSTFLAHRMNRLAAGASAPFTALPATQEDFLARLHPGDVLLVGPQLGGVFDDISSRAAGVGAHAAMLPPNAYAPAAADAVVRLATELIGNEKRADRE